MLTSEESKGPTLDMHEGVSPTSTRKKRQILNHHIPDTGKALTLWVNANGSTKGTMTAPDSSWLQFSKAEKQREKLRSAQKDNLSVFSLWEFLPYLPLAVIHEGTHILQWYY